MGRCAKESTIKFNFNKCEVLYFGMSDQGRIYAVNGRAVESVGVQKDLGVQYMVF